VIAAILDRTFRRESGPVLAALIRHTGDFDRAEDAFQDAVARALQTWPRDGVPANPGAWLYAAARRRAVDLVRRSRVRPTLADDLSDIPGLESELDPDPVIVPDERLRLLFTCCHPALSPQARVALSLRTLGGLTTKEVARAYLEPEATTAQRLVRAKQKIREANIPYALPRSEDLPDRLASVLEVLYLIFNEGYAATDAPSLIRPDLCREATRLARITVELLPNEPEPRGLLALMLLHDSRRSARVSPGGELIPLDEQDRTQWDHSAIADGTATLAAALPMNRRGPYQIQAAIASLHANAPTAAETDWHQIVLLYGALLQFLPTPVVRLNAAAAVGMVGRVDDALAWIDEIESERELTDYYLLPAARADLLRRAGRNADASDAYDESIRLVKSEPERRYLMRRLIEVSVPQTRDGLGGAFGTA
jgi:RNA polymerase sigma-70 factor (ECF subfamily)